MADLSSYSEKDLLWLLRDGNHSAYTEIYNRYFYLLYVHAYKKLRDEEQAKDVIQDLFATLWFKREYDLPKTNLAGYLFTAVRNKLFDLFAHQQVETKYLQSLQDYLTTHTSVPADSLVRENELKAYIEKAIEALPPKMKLIFEMSRNEHLSHKEIAEQLKVSENNVSKQVNNALKALKTKLGVVMLFLFLIN